MKQILSIMTLLIMAAPVVVQAQEAYAVEQDGTLTFYYDENRSSRGGTLYDVNTGLARYHYDKPRWCSSKITKAVFDNTFAGYTFENGSYMFSGCTNLAEVENLKALNTSETINLSYMFENCGKLAALNLNGLNTSKVEKIDCMFYRCGSLKSLALSGLDTKSLKSMFSTFSNSGLETINLEGLNTSGVTSFNGLFYSCSSLTEIDLSSLDTSAATDMESMFSMCTNLKSIYVGNGWNITHVTNGRSMFFLCNKLVGGNGTRCDGFINVDYDWAYVDSETTPGYLTYKASVAPIEAYAVADGGVLTFFYDSNKEKRTGTVYSIEEAYVGDGNFPAWRGASFTKVVFDSSFAAYQPTSTARWFHSCSSVTAMEGMENLNTSQSTSMSSMFYGCKGLKSLDLKSMNTSSATTMATMFYECTGLESLDLSSFDTGKVTLMTAMFYGCTALKQLNITSFNTSTVEDMQYLLFNCSSLTDTDLSNFDTHSVTNMECMFANCEAMKTIDLSSFNTAKVNDMYRMFYNDQQLVTIYAGDEWSTASVTNGGFMFVWCTSLIGGNGTACSGFMNYDYDYARIDGNGGPGYFTNKSTATPIEAYAVADGGVLTFFYDSNKAKRTGTVYNIEEAYVGDGNFPAWRGTSFTKVVFDSSFAAYQPTSTARWFHSCASVTAMEGMENLNTGQSTSMNSMFYGCKGLKNLNLSTLNTSSATAMATMFYDCTALESLNLSSFDTHNVTAMTAMFYGCTSLKNINVRSFDTGNVVDMQYMFYGCASLDRIDLSSFNTAKVISMECMFSNCEAVKVINIGGFNTAKVENMYRMFYNDQQLTAIYAGSGWSTASVTNGGFMFVWCTSLVGGNGTVCSGFMNYDHDYARIDGNGGPGYFTDVKYYEDGIADVSIYNREDAEWYSLDGKRALPMKGIYIRNGKKLIRK